VNFLLEHAKGEIYVPFKNRRIYNTQLGTYAALSAPCWAPSVGRTFSYNPLMLFYAIYSGLSRDKENKKSLGSSVADDIRDNEITNETMPRSISNPKEEEEKQVRLDKK
jgi:hypothetical protein